MKYTNASDETRVWPSIQRPDGTTLELEPGETADLELPPDFKDAHLRPARNVVVQTFPTVGQKEL